MSVSQTSAATFTENADDMALLSPGMLALLVAQFLSALADNAVLIAAIAIVKNQGMQHLVPLLQESFLVPYVLLAPFVGRVADRFSKKWVMLVSNILKFGGGAAMLVGVDPLVAYGAIGVGAALYSPAKYGILVQMFGPAKLVRANGMIEGSTIVAILLGVVLGGWLSDYSLTWAFACVLASYGLASLITLLVPRLPPENAGLGFHPWQMLLAFARALARLFRNDDARLSLFGTSIFWGSGSTLRLMLFAWVPAALLITDNHTPANLMGAVSVGIVIGAALAGTCVSLGKVNRALIGGLLLGPAVFALAFVHNLIVAGIIMAIIGASGGFFVVPLNALLQERGHQSIGAGNALAVQNFFENLAMLLFVGLYGASVAAGTNVMNTVVAFGLLLLIANGVLAFNRLRAGNHIST